MAEAKIFTTSSLLMAFLFAYSASVQLNDPDWYLWFPLYTFASIVNLINISSRYKQSQEIKNIAKLDLFLGTCLFVKVVIEDYAYELAGFTSMDLSQRVVREKTGSGLVVISMLLQLLSTSDHQSTKGKKIKVVPRYVNYGMAMLVILSYGMPLVFFGFLKGSISRK